jgi:predicted DNA-binding protein
MNFNVYLDDELSQKLESICYLTGKKRNTVIREALEVWLSQYSIARWPSSIEEFQGDSQMIPFESYRAELHEPTDGDIF